MIAASTLFAWFVVEGEGGDERIRAIEAVSGQTIMFLGVAALICGVLVMISLGGGKYVWATLGLLASAVAVGAAIWGIVDTDGLAARFADVGPSPRSSRSRPTPRAATPSATRSSRARSRPARPSACSSRSPVACWR